MTFTENPKEGTQAQWRSEERLRWVLAAKFGRPDASKVSGMVVMDLGCGSPQSSDADYGDEADMFAAHFPRLCARLGAKRVIGIDYHPAR